MSINLTKIIHRLFFDIIEYSSTYNINVFRDFTLFSLIVNTFGCVRLKFKFQPRLGFSNAIFEIVQKRNLYFTVKIYMWAQSKPKRATN